MRRLQEADFSGYGRTNLGKTGTYPCDMGESDRYEVEIYFLVLNQSDQRIIEGT